MHHCYGKQISKSIRVVQIKAVTGNHILRTERSFCMRVGIAFLHKFDQQDSNGRKWTIIREEKRISYYGNHVTNEQQRFQPSPRFPARRILRNLRPHPGIVATSNTRFQACAVSMAQSSNCSVEDFSIRWIQLRHYPGEYKGLETWLTHTCEDHCHSELIKPNVNEKASCWWS